MSSSLVNSSHFISVANGVFVDSSLPLNSRYEKLTKELYDAEIARMALYGDPVTASNRINRWVQQATRNKIQQIVSPEQVSNAPMVLASALYFKAKWETMFIEPDTRPRPFYLNGRNAEPIDIDTMATSGCFPFYEDKQRDAKIVGLPYQEGKSTMYIVVPNQSDRQKVRNFQNTLHSSQDWENIIDQMVVKTGTILLPKMKIENSLGLRDTLVSLGLRDVFVPNRSNLTAITRDDPILNDMIQRQSTRKPTKHAKPTNRPANSNQPRSTTTTSRTIQPTNDYYDPNANRAPAIQPTLQPNQFYPSVTTIPTSYQPTEMQTASPPTRWNLQSNSPEWVLRVNASICNMINYCTFKTNENYCSCVPNQQLAAEQRNCQSRPLIVEHRCSGGRLLLGNKFYQICLVEWYSEAPSCHQGCYSWREQCICCSQYPHTSQQASNEQSALNQQAITIRPSVAIAKPEILSINVRISTDERPSYTATRSPQVKQCREVCNVFGCWVSCVPVNPNRRFKRQAGNPQLFVGDVLHKVSLDINEQGTEGGAVTAIVIDRISSSFNLRVDGPFLIYLRNDLTRLPLFYGAVFDPRP